MSRSCSACGSPGPCVSIHDAVAGYLFNAAKSSSVLFLAIKLLRSGPNTRIKESR
jgi:hypothetical protein